jgi:hypothetical protein
LPTEAFSASSRIPVILRAEGSRIQKVPRKGAKTQSAKLISNPVEAAVMIVPFVVLPLRLCVIAPASLKDLNV